MVKGKKMKIQPIWEKCDFCDGTGSQAGGNEICPKCRGKKQIRTDSLHRKFKIVDGDYLVDISFDPPRSMECAFDGGRLCGCLCPAFNVKTDENGIKHYATCGRMPNIIVGEIVDDE